MRLNKAHLQRLISETIAEMFDELNEASPLKPFSVTYKNTEGIDKTVKIRARDKDDAAFAARQKLKDQMFDILFVKPLEEMTTTADVVGYDAPFGAKLKDLVDDEDDD